MSQDEIYTLFHELAMYKKKLKIIKKFDLSPLVNHLVLHFNAEENEKTMSLFYSMN